MEAALPQLAQLGRGANFPATSPATSSAVAASRLIVPKPASATGKSMPLSEATSSAPSSGATAASEGLPDGVGASSSGVGALAPCSRSGTGPFLAYVPITVPPGPVE